MGSYMNEDLMWERLKDIQREVENSRLLATGGRTYLRGFVRAVARLIGPLRRPPVPQPIDYERADATRDVA